MVRLIHLKGGRLFAVDKIDELQKSNCNWRRKAQRLRKEIKELKGG